MKIGYLINFLKKVQANVGSDAEIGMKFWHNDMVHISEIKGIGESGLDGLNLNDGNDEVLG